MKVFILSVLHLGEGLHILYSLNSLTEGLHFLVISLEISLPLLFLHMAGQV
jgi:hypothetical protein